MFFRVRTSGIPGAPDGVGVVVEGGRLYVSDGSGWTSMRVPQQGAQPQVEAADVSRAMAALADSVENVSVVEGQAFQGEPATIVNGRLDTAGLLRSLASELQAASGLPGSGLFPLDELTKHLGDVNASLMLSDRTGLLVGAVVTLEITGDQPGQSLRIELIYRVTSTNERVRFPRV
jgi:hypothetical protein